MEFYPRQNNLNPRDESSVISRVKERLLNNPEHGKIKESIRKISEGVLSISAKMEDKDMTKPHMGYALLQAGFGHKFVQDYLDSGVFLFFDEKGEVFDEDGFQKIMQTIENFEFERDKDKALVEDQE